MISNNSQGLADVFEFRLKENSQLAFVHAKEIAQCSEKQQVFFANLISAMANTQGGTIFIGIAAARKIAKQLTPNHNPKACEWLHILCKTAIFPEIPTYSIEKIAVSESDYIIGIHVAQSTKAPHLSCNYHFYKRVETKQLLMEEYEIRNAYQRGNRSEIELYSILNTNGIPIMAAGKFNYINFYPRFSVKNTSACVERFFKVEISIPTVLINTNFDSLQNHFSRFENGCSIFSIFHKTPLFQNELASVAEAHIILNAQNYSTFADGEIGITLFFSNGTHSRTYKCKELLLFKNKQIEYSDFTVEQVLFNEQLSSSNFLTPLTS
ncbi:MAG: ATP-binding protein [Bacteroidales bacterium]|jgi:hypothetical protein|nr:ATP-binding protein [Bacteroidales bacterium]